jgi:hypothetical protein
MNSSANQNLTSSTSQDILDNPRSVHETTEAVNQDSTSQDILDSPHSVHEITESVNQDSTPATSQDILDSPYSFHEITDTLTVLDSANLLTTSPSAYGICIDSKGWVVLVPTVLPGEKVKAKIYWNGIGVSLSDLVEVVEPSPIRIEPKCVHFHECSGKENKEFFFILSLNVFYYNYMFQGAPINIFRTKSNWK